MLWLPKHFFDLLSLSIIRLFLDSEVVSGKTNATQYRRNFVQSRNFPVQTLANCGRPALHSPSLRLRLSHRILPKIAFFNTPLPSCTSTQFFHQELSAVCTVQFGGALRFTLFWFYARVESSFFFIVFFCCFRA